MSQYFIVVDYTGYSRRHGHHQHAVLVNFLDKLLSLTLENYVSPFLKTSPSASQRSVRCVQVDHRHTVFLSRPCVRAVIILVFVHGGVTPSHVMPEM